MLSFIQNLIAMFDQKSPPIPVDRWVPLYKATLVITDIKTMKVAKQWELALEINNDRLRINGMTNDVDFLEHPCYNNVFKPWVEEKDWVILKDGTFFNFDTEEHVASLSDPQITELGEMSIEQMETLAVNLIDNRQPKTATGQFAIDYGMQIQAQLKTSEQFVTDYFSRTRNA